MLRKILKEDLFVKGCSRTDTGVSARRLAFQIYVKHLKMPLATLTNRLNFQFKKQNVKISIEEFFYASPALLIRRSVTHKTYVYTMDANLQQRSYNVF